MTDPDLSPTVGVIPAAGSSRRMGRPKALLELGGRSFVRRAVDALAGGGCRPVYVVVQAGDEQAIAAARDAGALVLENPEPGDGPIVSLRLVLAQLADETEAIMYLPVDHALVEPDHVDRILKAARTSSAPLALPVHHGKRGHPAYFHRRLFRDLTDPGLTGGARTVVHRHLEAACLVPFDDPSVILDIDTPEAYEEAGALFGRRRSGGEALGAAEAAELLLDVAGKGGTAAVATVVGHPSSLETLGRRMARILDVHGRRSVGRLGDDELDMVTPALLDEVIDDPRSRDGLRRVALDEGEEDPPSAIAELYLEVRRPLRELIIVGAGHIAQPMAHLGALLGYRVTVLDDRPDFATRERFPEAHRLLRADFSDPFAEVALHERSHLLLVTRGHKYDYECLVRALRTDPAPAYIGMIGSRRRVRATYVQLLDEGIDRALLDRIHAPVGLDIGAETPEEIAVAVAGELVLLDRGGTGAPLRDVERVAERFFESSAGGEST